MQNSKVNVISILASVFLAIILLIAAYIFGWQPSAVTDTVPPATGIQETTN